MLNRRQLLQSAAAAAPALMLSRGLASAQVPSSSAGMNVVLFMTDQERAIQHFPKGWSQRNLPGLTRLQRNGVTFERSFTNACMCSPARATLLTGHLPAQHGVKYTLEQHMPNDQYPQVELPPPSEFENVATVAAAAGYDVVYKGKFHLTKPVAETYTPDDLARYGFQRWNPPDGGADQTIAEAGGGVTDHDGRYMNADGDVAAGEEGVIAYLQKVAATTGRPFFLIVSLVNPHDVLMYPRNFEEAGYGDEWLDGQIRLPETVDEDLSTKPSVQKAFIRLFGLSGVLGTRRRRRDYLRFYANLMKSADRYLVQLLEALDKRGLTDSTIVIRTSDHGEMGMAHGGMRQKNFNAYEETIRVPLVYSNPKLFPRPRRSRELVSHVDFLPTIASLIGAPKSARAKWTGVDYSGLVLGTRKRPVQDHVVFTFDDFQAGQAQGPYVKQPNHIVCVREKRWKIAKYWDPAGVEPTEWEMYDLKADPLERRNIAFPETKRTEREERQLRRLQRKVAHVEKHQLRPLRNTPQPLVPVG